MNESIHAFLQSLIPYWENGAVRVVVILLISLVAAYLVRHVLLRLIGALTRRTATEFDDRLLDILRAPIFVSIFLMGISYAVSELQPKPPLDFIVQGVLKSVAVILWGMAAMKIGSSVLEILSNLSDRVQLVQDSTLPLFQIAYKLIVFGAIIYFAFISWNIDVTAWLASAGVVGIAVGFAAKDTLANLFAGIFIVTDAPYKIGDFIVLNGKERGMVTNIGIRSTRILTRDDIELTIPNAIISNSQITNESGGRHIKRRVRIHVSVAYGSDVDQVREILFDCARRANHVCAEPEPRCHFVEFGDSSLNFQLKIWIDEPVFKGRVTDQLNTFIYKALNEAGIEIPYPKRDVYIKEMPGNVPPLASG